jgi:putative membrane protein
MPFGCVNCGAFGGFLGLGLFGGIIMIIFWVIIIWAILSLIRMLVGGGTRDRWHEHHWKMNGREDEAMRILRERYAKGEIDKEEFERRKADLMMR